MRLLHKICVGQDRSKDFFSSFCRRQCHVQCLVCSANEPYRSAMRSVVCYLSSVTENYTHVLARAALIMPALN